MDGIPPPQDVWVDRRLLVGPSPIDGHGLFVAGAIAAGTVVVHLGGRLVTSAELDELMRTAGDDPAAYVDTLTVEEDAHLVLPAGTAVHFGNHRCDPTLWHVGPYTLAARRDLRAGDEATVDYATQSGAAGFVMTCRCGAPACRRQITSEDWRQPELQQRYRGHWVPALQQRIDRLGRGRSADRDDFSGRDPSERA